MDKDSYKKQFFQESKEILESANDDILQVEVNPDNKELLNSIFRGIHTIKGSAGAFEMEVVSEFAHHLENLLNALRDGRVQVNSDIIDVILEGTDYLTNMFNIYEQGSLPEVDDALISRFKSFIEDAGSSDKDSADNLPSDLDDDIETLSDDELLSSIFKGINQIKGDARALEFETISEFLYLLENLLNAVQDGSAPMNTEVINVILEGSDYLSRMFSSCEQGSPPATDMALIDKLKSFVENADSEAEDLSDQKDLIISFDLDQEIGEPIKTLLEEDSKRKCYKVNVNYTNEVFENGFDPLILLKNLKDSAVFYHCVTASSSVPAINDYEPLHLYLKPSVYIVAEMSMDDVKEMAFDPELVEVCEMDMSGGSKGGVQNDIEIDEENLQDFLLSANEMVDTMEVAIIDYEKNNSQDALNTVFRCVHTIKGDSDYIGLLSLSKFSHAFEFLLEKLRSGQIKRNANIVDLILKSIDVLKSMTVRVTNGERSLDMPHIYNRLNEFFSDDYKETGSPDKSAASSISTQATEAFIEQSNQYKKMLQSCTRVSSLDEDKEKVVRRALKGLKNSSEYVGIDLLGTMADSAAQSLEGKDFPSFNSRVDEIISFIDGLEREPKRIGEILVSEGKISDDDLSSALAKQKSIGEILVEDGKISDTDVDKALKKQEIMEAAKQIKTPSAEPEIRTMRIDESKIESFSNIIGELLVARNTYEHFINELTNQQTTFQEAIKSFKDNLHLFSRLTNDLHHGIMSMRMVPIKGIFQKFNRVVRDIARKQKKDIQFITEGEETDVDKKVADILSEPLIHIVRNSCDHGIESPAQRKDASKPEKGAVTLRAYHEGSNLKIKIIDDGKGIDREKVKEKAESLKIDISSYDDDALLNLIFMPGFSTKKEITDISGRGVGMDVVRTSIDSLKGHISVSSEKGNGTEITLTIPMTMGISDILLVEASGKVYALPFEYVLETIKISPKTLKRSHKGFMFYYRGSVIGAQWLDTLLNGLQVGSEFRNKDEISLVILKTGFFKIGIVVDRFIRNMEMAIKPVPPVLSAIEIISGVSILGDGRLVLVLNPEKLLF